MNWSTVNISPPGHRHFLEPNNGRCIVCSWGTSITNYCTNTAVLWPFCAMYLFPCCHLWWSTTILISWITSQEDVEVYYAAYLCLATMLAESDLKVEVIVIRVCMDGWWCMVASYPGLLASAFVTCSTNAGEGLVKLSHVVWRTWTCGGVAPSRKNSK